MMPETLTLADLIVVAVLLWLSGAVAGFATARARLPLGLLTRRDLYRAEGFAPEPIPDIHTVAERDARAFPSTVDAAFHIVYNRAGEPITVIYLDEAKSQTPADHATR